MIWGNEILPEAVHSMDDYSKLELITPIFLKDYMEIAFGCLVFDIKSFYCFG